MIDSFENTGLMLLTDTFDRYRYATDVVGVSKKYTYLCTGDRTAFVMGGSAILRLRGLS